jgi:hypothetical protein
MRKLLYLAAIAAAACTATAANATTFAGTFNVTSDQDGGQNGGLIVNTDPSSGSVGFNLTAPGSTTIDLFDIYTPEGALNLDDLQNEPISVAFDFSQPTNFSGSVGGTTTTTFTFFGFVDQGSVHWNNPGTLNFGNGGVLQISLNDANFGQHFVGGFSQNSADIYATFNLVSDSVPEPASWALMIGGFGMAGGMLRRRRTAAVAA